MCTQLYNHKWSDAIVEATKHPECDKFYGLRVRAGMHSGVVDQVTVHPNTKRVQYTGALLAVAKAVQGAAAGGQVLMSGDTLGQISSTEALDTDVVSYEDQTKRFMVRVANRRGHGMYHSLLAGCACDGDAKTKKLTFKHLGRFTWGNTSWR